MQSRFVVVVFPDEDGPAMSTSLVFFLCAISSAIFAIFFSCSASERLTMSVAFPCATASLKSPMVSMCSRSCHL